MWTVLFARPEFRRSLDALLGEYYLPRGTTFSKMESARKANNFSNILLRAQDDSEDNII